jgi:hypothetical protein
MRRSLLLISSIVIIQLIVTACESRQEVVRETNTPENHTETPTLASGPTPFITPTPERTPDPEYPSVPRSTDISQIPGYFQSIPYDGIRPVYDPQFASVDEVSTLMFDEELVMGVAWEGEVKAYPVTVLRFREMVNDELGGIPMLVTW